MTVTPEQAAASLVARMQRRHDARDAEAARLRAKLPAITVMLRDRYGASRVVLFGSLAWGGFHEGSDVDVAVAGVDAEQLGLAMADASTLMERTVELFALEALPATFRERVEQEGQMLS